MMEGDIYRERGRTRWPELNNASVHYSMRIIM